ncbi:hypothetical protein SPONN_2056 [uncultured Candidatus Thioglobus sp.]|nr:hypothetical protein SPONN_2056 [uncultured Candidatus Thioglobus sp.]
MQDILSKQLLKLDSHYQYLTDYHFFIQQLNFDFDIDSFNTLDISQKGVLEAYLKRFSSIQDFLGSKVFKSLLDISGISYNKMSEVLTIIEKEQIINLDEWIEFRNLRNHLEHDYPDTLQRALNDLKQCVDSFAQMENIIQNVQKFANKYQ